MFKLHRSALLSVALIAGSAFADEAPTQEVNVATEAVTQISTEVVMNEPVVPTTPTETAPVTQISTEVVTNEPVVPSTPTETVVATETAPVITPVNPTPDAVLQEATDSVKEQVGMLAAACAFIKSIPSKTYDLATDNGSTIVITAAVAAAAYMAYKWYVAEQELAQAKKAAARK